MAREHARLWLDINDDEHFQALSFDAQGFYARVVLTDPTLNYCGVMDWRPRRLTGRAPDLTLPRILTCASELEQRNYVLFDLDTEEALARSYIRRDELLRNPKMAATVIKAFPAVASRVLRAAIVTEIKRVHDEHPEYSSWSHKDTADGLSKLLGKTDLATVEYTMRITVPNPVQNGNPDPVPIIYPQSVPNSVPNLGPDHQSQSVGNPSTSTLHPSPAPLGGYVGTEGHQGADPADKPPPPCTRHGENYDHDEGCRQCEKRRKYDEAHAADRAREVEKRKYRERMQSEAAIKACRICDPFGSVNMPDVIGDGDHPVQCPHDADEIERGKKEILALRAQMAEQ